MNTENRFYCTALFRLSVFLSIIFVRIAGILNWRRLK